MPRPTISGPYDARHVSGVSITGATVPIIPAALVPGVQRSLTSNSIAPLEPDEVPTHMRMADHQPPRRSNTIAHSLSRPSLRLKTSISRLRGRSSSNSPDRHRPRNQLPSQSQPQSQSQSSNPTSAPPRPPRPSPPQTQSTSSYSSQNSTSHSNPHPPAPPAKPVNRPKRADSGTAIDFDDVPAEERPLGFKEILAVRSFEERMRLYERTREYWARADHGLGEWVGKVQTGRSLVV